jgi:CheY-like chemotaxis protein
MSSAPDPRGADHGRPILWAALLAIVAGALVVEALTAAAPNGPFWSDGLQLVAYMLSAIVVAALLGLIFAVPRSRDLSEKPITNPRQKATNERYVANSNLEQISDWLTKILVGAGLVQLARLPGALQRLGKFLGDGLKTKNASALAVAVVLYGLGLGFIFTYLWARLRLRVLFEDSEQQAEEKSQTKVIREALTRANQASPDPEPEEVVAEAAVRAASRIERRPPRRGRVLWVDDYPMNNTGIADAFKEAGISVHLALSTSQALAMFADGSYDLVITDLGRVENGANNHEAGLNLLQAIHEQNPRVPVIVYAGERAVARREELIAAGAVLATNRPTEVFSRALDILLQ